VPLLLAPNKEEVFMWRNQIAKDLETITSISYPTVSTVVVILLVIKTFTYKLRKVPHRKVFGALD